MNGRTCDPGPNKKLSMFRVTGRVGTLFFFLEKNIILCILKGILPFKMHKIIYFSENLKKFLGFTSKFRLGQVTLNTGIFVFCPILTFDVRCIYCDNLQEQLNLNSLLIAE